MVTSEPAAAAAVLACSAGEGVDGDTGVAAAVVAVRAAVTVADMAAGFCEAACDVHPASARPSTMAATRGRRE